MVAVLLEAARGNAPSGLVVAGMALAITGVAVVSVAQSCGGTGTNVGSRAVAEDYRVAVLPGDGIGPEVIAEAQATLELAAKLGGFGVEIETFEAGGAHHVATGQPMAPDLPERLAEFDAILAGPFGDPRVPDSVILWGTILALRHRFDQYVNLRPARTLPGVPGALRTPSSETFDVVVVRENTEGEYSGAGGRVHRGSGGRGRGRDGGVHPRGHRARHPLRVRVRARARAPARDQRHQVQRPASRDAVLGRGDGGGRARATPRSSTTAC